jgi:uncharacterized membrane protein
MLKFFSWWIDSGKLSNTLLLTLAIWVIIHLVSILKDGYYISKEPHKWIAWIEMVMMAAICTLAIYQIGF